MLYNFRVCLLRRKMEKVNSKGQTTFGTFKCKDCKHWNKNTNLTNSLIGLVGNDWGRCLSKNLDNALYHNENNAAYLSRLASDFSEDRHKYYCCSVSNTEGEDYNQIYTMSTHKCLDYSDLNNTK